MSDKSSREEVEDWKVLGGAAGFGGEEAAEGDGGNEGEGSFADSAAHSMVLCSQKSLCSL